MDNRINGRATLPPLTPAQTSAARRAASETASAPAISAQDSARFTASSPGDVLAELRDLIEVLANRVEKLEDTVNQSSAPRQAAREVVAPVPALPPGVTLPPLPSARVSAPASESVVIDPETWQDIPVEAVQVALSTAKLEGLTRSEKKTVERALDRVRTIAVSIDRGENPSPYQAELFALKQTLASPGNAGRNTLATSGAQLLAQVSAGKGKLEAAIQAEEGAANRGQDASGAQKRMLVLFDSYRALVQIERLLFSLNLSDLPPEKQRAVLADFSALRSLVGDVSDQKTTGLAANEQVEDIGARLQEFAASGQGNPVQQSAKDAVMRSRTALQGALKALDERQFNGTPPEALAADRAKLLAAAEALMTLGEAVVNAKPENGTQAMRGETRKALERAEALAEALGGGQHPAEIRNALFVTAQSLKDPISSRNSPAVQAAAAALQLMGQGEAANAEARGEIQAAIEAGVEPRLHDARAVQLARQAEDFELMRRALETVNFSGLTAQKVPEATSIIGKMQTIGEKVGAGEDFALHRAEYDNLGKQLRALAAAQAPSPGSPDNPPSLPGEPPAVAPPTPPGQAQPLPNSYTVKSGDYLSKIAREQLGDSSRWAELVQLNQERYPSLKTNPNLIHPSWTLQLPANKPSVERPAQPPTAVNPPATAPAQPPTAVNPPATAPEQPPTAVNPPATAP
ncbi:MAG: LysM peptidoglycan-binding domain-containing protein, partial [Candidatus Sericytochromatia bacterium]|nr:LysM peptidoglycan-binding domain-containing protein [Candidatus Sericytochromatia bacterium]